MVINDYPKVGTVGESLDIVVRDSVRDVLRRNVQTSRMETYDLGNLRQQGSPWNCLLTRNIPPDQFRAPITPASARSTSQGIDIEKVFTQAWVLTNQDAIPIPLEEAEGSIFEAAYLGGLEGARMEVIISNPHPASIPRSSGTVLFEGPNTMFLDDFQVDLPPNSALRLEDLIPRRELPRENGRLTITCPGAHVMAFLHIEALQQRVSTILPETGITDRLLLPFHSGPDQKLPNGLVVYNPRRAPMTLEVHYADGVQTAPLSFRVPAHSCEVIAIPNHFVAAPSGAELVGAWDDDDPAYEGPDLITPRKFQALGFAGWGNRWFTFHTIRRDKTSCGLHPYFVTKPEAKPFLGNWKTFLALFFPGGQKGKRVDVRVQSNDGFSKVFSFEGKEERVAYFHSVNTLDLRIKENGYLSLEPYDSIVSALVWCQGSDGRIYTANLPTD